jgi:hypothetical protein
MLWVNWPLTKSSARYSPFTWNLRVEKDTVCRYVLWTPCSSMVGRLAVKGKTETFAPSRWVTSILQSRFEASSSVDLIAAQIVKFDTVEMSNRGNVAITPIRSNVLPCFSTDSQMQKISTCILKPYFARGRIGSLLLCNPGVLKWAIPGRSQKSTIARRACIYRPLKG